jgi:hypothetical protein
MIKSNFKHDGGTRMAQFEIKPALDVTGKDGIKKIVAGQKFVIYRNTMFCGEAKTKELVIEKLIAYLQVKGFKALSESQVDEFLNKPATLILGKGNSIINLKPQAERRIAT